MNPFRFTKPKGPGFGIARQFYVSVLAGTARLPSVLEVLNPEGVGGAVRGFGAPLGEGTTKADLARPMERGVYALATADRKTVLRMMVLSKEEAGFDPEAFARSSLAEAIDPDLLARIRATWSLLQLTFESHDPAVYPSLEFFDAITRRLAALTEGCIADPISQRYRLPDWVPAPRSMGEPIRWEDVLTIRALERAEHWSVHTLGLQKFALPEIELCVSSEPDPAAAELLGELAQSVLLGNPLPVGKRVGAPGAEFTVSRGGADRALWEGIECLALEPPRGQTAESAIEAWARTRGLR